MKNYRPKVVDKVVFDCISRLNKDKLSREELIVALGQMLIRVGYSIHWSHEVPVDGRPDSISAEIAEKLYESNPSTGTTLMKVGFYLQDRLLIKD